MMAVHIPFPKQQFMIHFLIKDIFLAMLLLLFFMPSNLNMELKTS